MFVRPAAALLLVCLFAAAGTGLLCAARCVHTVDMADTASGHCHVNAASTEADLTGIPSACHEESKAAAPIVAERLIRADAPVPVSVPTIVGSGRIHRARNFGPRPLRYPDIILFASPLRI